MTDGPVRDEVPPGHLRSFKLKEIRTTDATLGWRPRDRGVANGAAAAISETRTERHTATRRLCAGTYLDREFRQRLLRDVYNCRERKVAPSYGYNLAQVMRHAWRAWWLELTRDAVAVTVVIVTLLTVPLGTLLVVGLLAMWFALRACWRVLAELLRILRQRKPRDYFKGARLRAELAASWLLGSICVVGGAVLAMRLNPQGSRLGGDLTKTGMMIGFFVLLFVITGVFRQWQLDRLHHPSAVEGRLRSRRLRTLGEQQDHLVTIYSGHRPFIGSGRAARQVWSFAQRLVRKKEFGQDHDEEFPPSQPPFTTYEIVQHLKRSINDLKSTSHRETSLPGLTVRDRVFIDGAYVNEVPKGLRDTQSPSQIILKKVMEQPREEVRHHIECQIIAWDGELVTTVFVHISLQGRTLYVEFSTYALTPTPPRFRVIDEVGGTGPKAALRTVVHELSELPDLLHAPRRLAAVPKQLVNACRAQRDPTVKDHEHRDIGAQISAREIGQVIADDEADNYSGDVSTSRQSHASHEETSYFQLHDVIRHSQIIERQLLAAIERFLKQKNVDTSEFLKRAEAILNNGVISTGHKGTINIENSAFGNQPSVENQPSDGGTPPAV